MVKKREAYEEIRVACMRWTVGISEAEAYRRFGERCGQVKYKTLSTLLIQNLQKGSRYLADLLGKGIRGSLGGAKKKSKSAGRYSSNKTASSDGLDAPGGDGGDHASGMPFLLRRVGLENRERKCEVTNENMWKYVKEFAMERMRWCCGDHPDSGGSDQSGHHL